MPYIEIAPKGLPLTKKQKRDLTARAIDVFDSLESKWESVLVFVEESDTPLSEGECPHVAVHVKASPQSISASDRAKITWATIDMLKSILGNSMDVRYEVVLEETSRGMEEGSTGDLSSGAA